MKRISLGIIAVVLALISVAVMAVTATSDDFTLSFAGPETLTVGSTVTITAKIKNINAGNGISGVGFVLNYNDSALQLIAEVTKDNTVQIDATVPEGWENLSHFETNGSLAVNFINANSQTGIKENGKIEFRFTFKVIGESDQIFVGASDLDVCDPNFTVLSGNATRYVTSNKKPQESVPATESSTVSEIKPDVSQTSENGNNESKSTESENTESNFTESQPVESQPTESKPTESQPTESKPAESGSDTSGSASAGTESNASGTESKQSVSEGNVEGGEDSKPGNTPSESGNTDVSAADSKTEVIGGNDSSETPKEASIGGKDNESSQAADESETPIITGKTSESDQSDNSAKPSTESPKTGGKSNIVILSIVSSVLLATILVLFIARKKRVR